MAYDENQTFVAESFADLFRDGRNRLTIPKEELSTRHEFCDDMAQMLVETCQTIHFRDGVDESTVLDRVHEGLMQQRSQFNEDEAWWVVRRAAELQQWHWDTDPRRAPASGA